jgi:hypothetical protein
MVRQTIENFAIAFLFLLIANVVYGQDRIKNANILFLDSLDKVYGGLCTERTQVKFNKAKIKTDRDLIRQLNFAYGKRGSLVSCAAFLHRHGFMLDKEESGPDMVDTVVYYKHAGNLRGFVFFKSANKNVLSKKIIIATDSQFSCPYKDDSQVFNFIDFIYLKNLVNKIKFPLKVASSNVELESK